MDDPVVRGREAQRLLNEPLLKQAFEGVRQKLLDRLEETPLGDIQTQHEIALTLQSLKYLKKHIENWMRDGELFEARQKQTNLWNRFAQRTGVRDG